MTTEKIRVHQKQIRLNSEMAYTIFQKYLMSNQKIYDYNDGAAFFFQPTGESDGIKILVDKNFKDLISKMNEHLNIELKGTEIIITPESDEAEDIFDEMDIQNMKINNSEIMNINGQPAVIRWNEISPIVEPAIKGVLEDLN